jgi:hypothetical protein
VKFLESFGQFCCDFIIGDDCKIAVEVVTALVVLLVFSLTNVHRGVWFVHERLYASLPTTFHHRLAA